MAQQGGLSPYLFSGGAVPVNSNEFTQTYLNQLAHEQAQKDATLKYFGELGGRLTGTGMIDEDASELIKQKNEWQAFNMQNKDKLANTNIDGGKAYMESMSRMNKMQELIDKSKYKSDFTNKVLKPLLVNPKYADLMSDRMRTAKMAFGLPVSDPNYRPMTTDDIEFKNKPFDSSDMAKIIPLVKPYMDKNKYYGNPQVIKDPATGTQMIKKTLNFGDDALSGMQSVGQLLLHNPSFSEMAQKELDPSSPEYAAHNTVFQKHFGRDITDVNDIATAHVIEATGMPDSITTNPTTDPFKMEDVRQSHALTRIAQRNLDTIKNMGIREAYKYYEQGGLSLAAHDHLQNQMMQAKTSPPVTFTTDKGNTASVYVMPLDAKASSLFAKPDPATGKRVMATITGFNADGTKFVGLHPVVDAKGNIKKDANGNMIVKEDLMMANQVPLEQVESAHEEYLFGKRRESGSAPYITNPNSPKSTPKKQGRLNDIGR